MIRKGLGSCDVVVNFLHFTGLEINIMFGIDILRKRTTEIAFRLRPTRVRVIRKTIILYDRKNDEIEL